MLNSIVLKHTNLALKIYNAILYVFRYQTDKCNIEYI